MAEYIDRNAFLEHMKKTNRYFDVKHDIENFPAADVAPIKHGQWEWFDEDIGTPITGHEREWGWRCSRCKHELPDDYDDPDYRPMLDYCPYCGAKMDGGED